MKFAVIYARYSSLKQNDESIEQQVEVCQEYAKQHNLTVIDIYADRATTGRNDQRQAFQKMLKDSAKGKFTVVLAYKSNRIGRNMLQALSNEDKLAKNGVTIEYAREMFGNDSAGRFALRSMMNLNQFYSENLGEDVMRGMNAGASEGRAMSKQPYGFRIVDGKFAIDFEQAKAVREIYRLYNEGSKLSEICGHLTDMGYRSSTGGDFSLSCVRNILVKDVYRGHYSWNGIPMTIPAIIDDATWELSRKQREARASHPQKHKARETYYLSGKLFCSDCGNRMTGTSAQDKGRTYRWYICKHDKRKIEKDYLENLIVTKTQDVLTEGHILDTIVSEIYKFNKKMEEHDTVLEALQKEQIATKNALDNIVRAIEQGIVFDALTSRYSALEKRMKELDQQIASRVHSNIKLSKADIESVVRNYTAPMLLHDNGEAKKLILEEFVHHAVLFDDHVVVYYNFLNPEKEPISKDFKIDLKASTIKPNGSPNSIINEVNSLVIVGFSFPISKKKHP